MRSPADVAAAATAAVIAGAYWCVASSQSQLLGAFPRLGVDQRRRQVALTFDDGPNEPYTSRLADLLAQRDVRATFFQVGRAVQREPDVSRALAAAGHVIGNHSHTHELRRCFTAAQLEAEIRHAEDALVDALGLRPRLYRPPWLVRTPATFRAMRHHELTPVSGTFCHPFEVGRASGAVIARSAVARTTPGRMIIFHDGYNGRGADRTRTLDAVARTVDTLLERNWSFTTVDRLLRVAAYDPAGRAPVVRAEPS